MPFAALGNLWSVRMLGPTEKLRTEEAPTINNPNCRLPRRHGGLLAETDLSPQFLPITNTFSVDY